MLCIGRGAGTINGLRPDTDNADPIPVCVNHLIDGLQEITLGKTRGQPTIHTIRAHSATGTARISAADDAILFVIGNDVWVVTSGGGSKDFNIEEADGGLVVIAI